MTKEQYESLSLAALREIAKSRHMKGTSALRKEKLILRMLEQDAEESSARNPEQDTEETVITSAAEPKTESPIIVSDAEPKAEKPIIASAAEPKAESPVIASEPEPKMDLPVTGSEPEQTEKTIAASETEPKKETQTQPDSPKRNPSRRVYTVNNRRNGKKNEQGTEKSEARAQRYAPLDAVKPQEAVPKTDSSENEVSAKVRTEEETVSAPESHQEEEQALADFRPELAALDSGTDAKGVLDIPEGNEYGFLRTENYLKGDNDIYVSPSQIRRFRLETGDMITGSVRAKTAPDKPAALLYVKSVNGRRPEEAMRHKKFESLTPIFPNEKMPLERAGGPVSMRVMDLFCPIGKGQRGMIVSPPKAGKTTLLKDIATSLLRNNPKMYLLVVLIDERPEEVTDFKEAIHGENVEVVHSTFDNEPGCHKRVAEIAISRAKRLVELDEDVVILIDSITRLTRAYNLTVQASGRTLSGGLDPASLNAPKKFFGAARNIRGGGSLTILATALVDTGSKMDDVVYEEFKGTGNMELVLDRKMQERRLFPAIDIAKSGTRREELLLSKEEKEAADDLRNPLFGMKPEDALDNLLDNFRDTKDNKSLIGIAKMRKYGNRK